MPRRSRRREALGRAQPTAGVAAVALLMTGLMTAARPGWGAAATADAGWADTVRADLMKALTEDVLPESSSSCSAGAGETNATQEWPGASDESEWEPTFAGFEEQLFAGELSHDDADPRRSWKLRVGTGGNVYSFIGAFGEAMPPQVHDDAPWIDEVWQMVGVDTSLNDPANGNAYFVHQAGVYSREDDLDDKPFFSPLLASSCSSDSCEFAAWGQQAHVPTAFKSKLFYYTRFKDCGNGVVEATYLMHQFRLDDRNDHISYTNMPWGGVRPSVFKDFAIADAVDGTAQAVSSIPGWGCATSDCLPNLDTFGGYSLFAQDLPLDDTTFTMPQDDSGTSLSLVPSSSSACSESSGHTSNLGRTTLHLSLVTTITVAAGEAQELVFHNGRGGSMDVDGVHHWAWNGNTMYFFPTDADAAECNNLFHQGDTITVTLRQSDLTAEENLALAFVTGKDAPESFEGDDGWATDTSKRARVARMRFGMASSGPRDYLVWTVNIFPYLYPGQTLYSRQYAIASDFPGAQVSANDYVDEVRTGFVSDYSSTGRDVVLYAPAAGASFTALLGDSDTVTVADLTCTTQCSGATTPRGDWRPLFHITCGTESYVGHDPYHFDSPQADPEAARAWRCGTDAAVHPQWTLLGYFEEDACIGLQDAAMDFGACGPCEDDEFVHDSTCAACGDSCAGGCDDGTGRCQECAAGYFRVVESGLCVPCADSCSETEWEELGCQQGSEDQDRVCRSCSDNNCEGACADDTGVCDACASGTYRAGDECVACASVCTDDEWQELDCQEGAETQNRVCNSCASRNCAAGCSDSSGRCDACADGFYDDAGQDPPQGNCVQCSAAGCSDDEYQATLCTAASDNTCTVCNAACGGCSGDGAGACEVCAESFRDCGDGICVDNTCEAGESCEVGADCASGVCGEGVCQAPACNDGVMNGYETDVDCGGHQCDPCGNGSVCTSDEDCSDSSFCSASGTCGACDRACTACTDGGADACIECAPGYFRDGLACVLCSETNEVDGEEAIHCDDGRYELVSCQADGEESVDRVCADCDVSCADTCAPFTGVCYSCASGYFRDGDDCIMCSPACGPLEWMQFDCQDSSNEGAGASQDRVCAACGANNCAGTCADGTGVCDACETGFYREAGACVQCASRCGDGEWEVAACSESHDRQCASCEDNNCAGSCEDATGFCEDCASGFWRDGAACVSCSAPCGEAEYEVSPCGHQDQTDAENGEVAEGDRVCASCAANNCEGACADVTGTCDTCAEGYFRHEDLCVPCSPGCAINEFEVHACQADGDDEGQDRVCHSCGDNHCDGACSDGTGACTACVQGYVLTTTGICVPAADDDDGGDTDDVAGSESHNGSQHDDDDGETDDVGSESHGGSQHDHDGSESHDGSQHDGDGDTDDVVGSKSHNGSQHDDGGKDDVVGSESHDGSQHDDDGGTDDVFGSESGEGSQGGEDGEDDVDGEDDYGSFSDDSDTDGEQDGGYVVEGSFVLSGMSAAECKETSDAITLAGQAAFCAGFEQCTFQITQCAEVAAAGSSRFLRNLAAGDSVEIYFIVRINSDDAQSDAASILALVEAASSHSAFIAAIEDACSTCVGLVLDSASGQATRVDAVMSGSVRAAVCGVTLLPTMVLSLLGRRRMGWR